MIKCLMQYYIESVSKLLLYPEPGLHKICWFFVSYQKGWMIKRYRDEILFLFKVNLVCKELRACIWWLCHVSVTCSICGLKCNQRFCYEWCIVGYGTVALWDLWIRSINSPYTVVRNAWMSLLVSYKVMDWVLSDLCHAALAGLLANGSTAFKVKAVLLLAKSLQQHIILNKKWRRY